MKKTTKSIAALTFVTISQSVIAGGIQNWTMSANSIGNFGAGIAATANNPDTSYYNPAGMPWIQHQDMGLSLTNNIGNAKYNGAISNPVSGSSNGAAQGGTTVLTPNLFYVAPLNKKWEVGFSVTSPYKYELNYGNGAITAPVLSKFRINTVNLTPSLAFRFINSLSVGVGLDIERASIQFNQASVGGGSQVDNKLHDWGVGWNGGILWQPAHKTRLGVSYHSYIRHKNSGNSNLTGTITSSSRVTSNYRLPADTTLSFYQGIGKRLDLLGSANYTQWSKTNIVLNNVSTTSGLNNQTVLANLRDSWLFAVGINAHLNKKLVLKTGFGYDQSAVAKNTSSTLILPDANYYVASVGSNYTINDSFNVDLGFSHYFTRKQNINSTTQNASIPVTSQGSIETGRDVAGIQINWLMT
ncbi:MAG: outer membrane protein transport protein [Pseudomonadota bacterium]